MIISFLRHYLELPAKNAHIVCLGGGVGTAQVLKGLKNSSFDLTAVVSMADDGGSAGRLRRAFSVPPPGDLVNCLAALSEDESTLTSLFLYRFAGKRYGVDTDLGGQKLGNLIFVALTDIFKGDTEKALEEFSKIISSRGRVLPATLGDVNIWAKTNTGKKVFGEQNIDLGHYNSEKALKEVYLEPSGVKAYKHTLEAIKSADTIVVGPGDLFSTVLPVLIVEEIKNLLKKSKAKKMLIINIANKPFETPKFTASDYVKTINHHLGKNIFDTIVVNTRQNLKIPSNLRYDYVHFDKENFKNIKSNIVKGDLVNSKFPIYHDPAKIGRSIVNLIK